MRFEKGKFGLSAKGECVDCKKKMLKIFEEDIKEDIIEDIVEEEEFFEDVKEDIVDKKTKKNKK